MNKTTQVIPRQSKKLPSQFGIGDYFKFYNKNYPYKVDRKLYNNVISDLHQFIVDELVESAGEFTLPHRMGYLLITKKKQGVKLLPDNTVINNAPPDWNATKKLWAEDEEARDKKILVRHRNLHTGGYVYSVRHTKYNATFKNKTASLFKAARDFNRAITKRIKDYSKQKYNAHEYKTSVL